MKTHLENYLDFYCSLSKPGYAVLITGAWGVGKTYQVLNKFKITERYYVSLFGVESIEQINAEVIALCNPKLSMLSSSIESLSDAAASLGGVYSFSGLSSSAFNAIFKQRIKADRVLIFDDLERCKLPLKDILGVVNQYVEHHGFQVVAIAHDEKIGRKFKYVKEKVFGQTIEVFADFDGAYDSFSSMYSRHEDKRFLGVYKKIVLSLFITSNTSSLRILKHVVEDMIRLKGCLRTQDLSRQDLMTELLGLFVAMNIEIRKGNISGKELNERQVMPYWAKAANETVKNNIDNINGRYNEVDFYNTLLTNSTLYAMYFSGVFDFAMLQSDIDDSIYGVQASKKVPWKLVSSFDFLEDDVVNSARVEMNKQFDERLVNNSGEMLHIFSLKMFMVDYGVEDGTIAKLEKECISYIDDLYANGDLPPRENHERWFDLFSDSHDGIMYWVKDSYAKEFKNVFDYLVEKREEVLFDNISEVWEDLKNKMHHDSHAFLCYLASNKFGIVKYQTIPILKFIDADDFINTWMCAPKENWRNISLALSFRYSHFKMNKYLQDERDWARVIYFKLNKVMVESSGLQSLRIKRIIPESLVNYFKDISGVYDYSLLSFKVMRVKASTTTGYVDPWWR